MLRKILFKNKSASIFRQFYSLGVIAAFSDRIRDLGFSSGKKIKNNRQAFLRSLGIDYRHLIAGEQVHGCKIRIVDQRHKGKGAFSLRNRLAATDGLITREKNLPLAVFTADCLSVFLSDPKKKVIGLIHAGWRGTQKGIVFKAINLMQKRFKTNPKDLIVGFGPAIRKCCYEVGDNFAQLFPNGIIKRKNKIYLDLIVNNKQQLIKTGVLKKNIFDSGICTSCQNRNFFSFRREGERAGRMMSVIMLKEKNEG